jgi:hypothetical protein
LPDEAVDPELLAAAGGDLSARPPALVPAPPSVLPPLTFAEVISSLDPTTVWELILAQAALLGPEEEEIEQVHPAPTEIPEAAQELVRTGHARSMLMFAAIGIAIGLFLLILLLSRRRRPPQTPPPTGQSPRILPLGT